MRQHSTFKFKKDYAQKILDTILRKQEEISFEEAASIIAYKINEETALSCSLQAAKDILRILTCSITPYEIKKIGSERKIIIRIGGKGF